MAPQPTLHVWEGLFFTGGGFLRVGGTNIETLLEEFAGSRVHVVARHLPPTPPVLGVPGYGACRWPSGTCPAGHLVDPGWLWLADATGDLIRVSEGTWRVGAAELPLRTYLNGHLGSVIVFQETSDAPGTEEALAQARVLSETLQGLLQRLRGSQENS